MDKLEMAKALFQGNTKVVGGGQTKTVYGVAEGDSAGGKVLVNLGGDTVSPDDDQQIEVETTFAVKAGDEVIISLFGADGTGKSPVVTGVVGRGDEQQEQIDSVKNYFWTDDYGAHITLEPGSVEGKNVLLDSDSLDIREGASNSESDQTVLASFGESVTIGSRRNSSIGGNSIVIGWDCSATAGYSYAEGFQSRATGLCSHAEGQATLAEGMFSHAEGYGGGTHGKYSHAEGYYTLASDDYQHVQGKGNVSTAATDGKYCDVIGNGTMFGDPRFGASNAYNMDWHGNAEFQGEVYVGGCTPNGETPYPVVRYNTSISQQEYYDGSAWAQVPGGGGWTSLWTNSAPSSNFSAQTVPLDLSGYTWIAIIAKTQTTGTVETTHLVRVGSSVIMSVPNLAGTQYFYKRQADVTTSGITFGTGYRNNTGTSGANYCIPVAVYGIC